jgi:trehalose/maltose hydrolase-like predicted phosphorylase
MRKLLVLLLTGLFVDGYFLSAQDPWLLRADSIDPSAYYGETVANGMVGIVSSPEPFRIKDVVLAGAYDLYGRGRVSNFLRSFNLLNMRMDIDGANISSSNVSSMKQILNMREASFTTTFEHGDKATISYTYYALRQLPYTVLMDVTVKARKDISINAASVMEAPDALRDVENYYNEIDRPHVVVSLLTLRPKVQPEN